MNIQFRIAIADSYETDKYIRHFDIKLCETYQEAMNAVLEGLRYLQEKDLGRWYVELTIYKYRWEDLKKFGRTYNDLVEIRYYPKDFNEEE